MIWALEMLWRRSVPVLVAICLLESCSTPFPPARCEVDMPALPRLSIASFQPRIRDQVQKAYHEVESKPKDAETNGRIGMLLHAFEQYESAELCYRRARSLDPNKFQWAYYLGLVQAIDGKNQEAATTLQAAMRLDPGYLPARLKTVGREPGHLPVDSQRRSAARPGLLLAGTSGVGQRPGDHIRRAVPQGLPAVAQLWHGSVCPGAGLPENGQHGRGRAAHGSLSEI